jgi:tetratricopeptide (TPR) repeat protein
MTKFRSRFGAVVLGAIWLAIASGAHAEALVKPLPQPDTRRLSAQQAKDLADARAEFDKVRVGLVGNALAEAYAQIGALYLRFGFDDVAAVAFYDASQLAPKDPRWRYLQGVVARTQKRNAEARADFEAALTLDKNYLPIRFRLADTLVDLGQPDAARTLLTEAATQHPDQAIVHAVLGRLELRQKRYADAATHLAQALKLEPQADALYQDLAEAYAGQGNAERAAEARAKAGSRQPRLDDPLVAGIYADAAAAPPPPASALEAARRMLADRDFAAARALTEAALKEKPDDAEALALAARLDALLGKSAAARDEAARALKLEPDSAAANLSQGMVHEFAGEEAKAYPYYVRALKADPAQPDARLLLGNALMRRHEYAEAAEQYRQLAAVAPGAEAEARLAAAEVAAGRCAEALATVNQALAKRAQDGDLMQVFVRLASTCPAASAQERSMALDYAKALYRQLPNAANTTALALAQAAAGQFDDAQKSQAEAIYEAVRVNDTERAAMYRETMRQFVAHHVPDKPWPPAHPYFAPPPLTPLPPEPAPKR